MRPSRISPETGLVERPFELRTTRAERCRFPEALGIRIPSSLVSRMDLGPDMAFFDRDDKGARPALAVTARFEVDALVDLIILPAQFASVRGGPPSGIPALLVAIIEEAIASLMAGARSQGSRQRAEAKCAERWISSSDASHPFSFESICDALDLDASALRREILQQAAKAPARPARARRRHEVPRGDRRLEHSTERRRRPKRVPSVR